MYNTAARIRCASRRNKYNLFINGNRYELRDLFWLFPDGGDLSDPRHYLCKQALFHLRISLTFSRAQLLL